MQEKPNVEELIADSMTLLLIRAQKLPKMERLAIAQEFREWPVSYTHLTLPTKVSG